MMGSRCNSCAKKAALIGAFCAVSDVFHRNFIKITIFPTLKYMTAGLSWVGTHAGTMRNTWECLPDPLSGSISHFRIGSGFSPSLAYRGFLRCPTLQRCRKSISPAGPRDLGVVALKTIHEPAGNELWGRNSARPGPKKVIGI